MIKQFTLRHKQDEKRYYLTEMYFDTTTTHTSAPPSPRENMNQENLQNLKSKSINLATYETYSKLNTYLNGRTIPRSPRTFGRTLALKLVLYGVSSCVNTTQKNIIPFKSAHKPQTNKKKEGALSHMGEHSCQMDTITTVQVWWPTASGSSRPT